MSGSVFPANSKVRRVTA